MNRTRSLLTGMAALVATIALVVGIPVGLARYVGWPLPSQLPTWEEISLALRSGIDPQLLINILAIVVWVAWLQLTIALTFEVTAAVRGRSARKAPVVASIQTAAARLVATITIAAATLAPLRPDVVLAQPLPTVAVQAQNVLPTELVPPGLEEPSPRVEETREGTHPQPVYEVGRFDTLWSIAEITLGDGRRWQEIRRLNEGRPTATGGTITVETEHVPPGTSLYLPADANVPSSQADPGDGQTAHQDVTVERGDSFWKIAEAVLSDAWQRQPTDTETADYWRRLVDANQDRLAPPHIPDLIYPGQIFQLPPIPEDPAPPTTTTRSDREHDRVEVTVEHGDSFWKIAEAVLSDAWQRQPTDTETADYWRRLVDANRDRLAPPHDPDLIYPGQIFQLPPLPEDPVRQEESEPDLEDEPTDSGPSQTQSEIEPPLGAIESDTSDVTVDEAETSTPSAESEAPPSETVEPASPAVEPTVESEVELPDETTDPDRDGTLLPVVARLAGLGLLGAGVVALIDRLRRIQLRQRRPGTIPTPPPETARETEAILRAASAPTAAELIDLALRSLAHQITENHIPSPQLVGVHLTDEMIRLLLWTPHHEPPPGWQVEDNGYSWTLPTTVDPTHLHLLADTIPAPYPTLVSVGHDDSTQLLLDLEQLGATQINGEPDQIAATCYTMATELAASPIADTLEIVCVGFGKDLEHLERVTTVDSLADILPTIEQKTAALENQSVTPLEGRLAPGGDTWTPLVIFDPNPEKPENADQLLAVAHRGRSICAVVGYPTDGPWRLEVSDGTVAINPLGHSYSRRDLTPKEQTDIADLTMAAKDRDGMPEPPAAPRETSRDHDGSDVGLIDVTSPARPHPEVRTLGVVRVEGMAEQFPEVRCLELVTYLALHPQGVESDTIMEALYPGRPPNPSRLWDVVHRARRALGEDPDGNPYVPHHRGVLYKVNPNLGCDLRSFEQHVHEADQIGEPDSRHHLQAALDLVEGAPFSGIPKGYEWAHTEGINTQAIVAVDNTAHRLARIALAADDSDLTTWAARRGLAASWACEECYRNLMRAAITRNDRIALDAVYNELIAIVDDEHGADATDLLEPETINLYQQHRRPWKRDAG